MKINVCCGNKILAGYTNVDIAAAAPDKTPDLLCDARKIPLPDGCADEVMCIHGLEHFYRFEVDDVINEWHRLLKKRGVLILELPNIIKCCQNLIDGVQGKHPEQMGLWGIFGDWREGNPYMNHRWGYSPASLTELLEQHGFKGVRERPTVFHGIGRANRDMRLEALKA